MTGRAYTYTWGTAEDITDDVTVTVDSTNKTVSVTGYDYSAAPVVYSESTDSWSGYKLVVEFEVIPDTDCTDWSESGSYATNAGAVLDYGDSEEDAVEVDNPVAPVETYQVTYS
ncbi:MAG: hypothetical protein LUE97_07195 [Oscillospiraceae bacterium]|nr:hypothetical protein [Oscillospiraceae bacterium]